MRAARESKELVFTSTGYSLELLALSELTRTERHDQLIADQLAQKIALEGVWTHPIVVEKSTRVILDGHHRYNAAIQLGLSYVPCICVDYDDTRVQLDSWREDLVVTKKDVLAVKISGQLFPYKTTKHLFSPPLGNCVISITDLKIKYKTEQMSENYSRQLNLTSVS